MAGFKCPFCGQMVSIIRPTFAEYEVDFEYGSNVSRECPRLRICIFKCPNCKKETVFAKGVNGYIKNKTVRIYPESSAIQFPEFVPVAIRSDYEEACAIRDKSPKAAATLARRCLQGMIRDFWGITEKRLIDEINALKGKVPAAQWAAIDAVRKVGNIGAHMERDVNVIVDVEPEEADKLLQLIELLIDKWYIAREDEKRLYEQITGISDDKTAARSQ